MGVTSTECPGLPELARTPLAVAVADANWFTTENLFREIHREAVTTLLLKCIDYYNAWNRGTPPWTWGRALACEAAGRWRREHVLPSGWMKRFPTLGMRPISRSIVTWKEQAAPDSCLALVMTYPHYLYLRDLVRPNRTVYFNIDDYSQYWPRIAQRVHDLERRAVLESDLTVCVARARVEALRAAVPAAAGKIRHLPHGCPSDALHDGPCAEPAAPPDDIAHLPRPLLGYVGTLEDRIDWELLSALAETLPHASLVLIGQISGRGSGDWGLQRRRVLARSNVHALGWRPQEVLGRYNRAFDLCLIPYRADHPFNLACCPTKIMDYMATGRPIVSTAVPECRLHADRFHVADDPAGFLEAVRAILAAGSNDGRAAVRFEYAKAHTCARMVERLLDWLTD
jgi:teichuronic acid biosynthesis glycosyltransferase TuaH